jgi:hypothetical protein
MIQNIGGLTCLLCHLQFSGHFVELGLYCGISVILPFTKYTKAGCCDAGRTWARHKFQQTRR